MASELMKRIMRLEQESAAANKKVIWLWRNAGQSEQEVLAEAVASGRITDAQRVAFEKGNYRDITIWRFLTDDDPEAANIDPARRRGNE